MAPVVAIRGWRTRQGYDWVTDGRLVVSAGSADNAGHAVGVVACVVPLGRESNPATIAVKYVVDRQG
ncbi:hypothetical protein BPODLACK_03775 [Gordonia sp. YY1]|nr:hypothetical protein BPODLACK_03775 [Gordonia sp. YY1]